VSTSRSLNCRRTTKRPPVRPPIRPPIRIAQFVPESAPIDLTRLALWERLWDLLLAPPAPRDAIATPLAIPQTYLPSVSPKNLAIGGGGHV